MRGWTPEMGWRGFADEIVIVLVGVLIALWVGRVASGIDWHARDRQNRAALTSELADTLTNLETRRAVASCQRRRLEGLQKLLDGALVSGRLPAVSAFPTSPGANWESGVWRVVLDSETAANLPPQELNALALVYANVDRLQSRNDKEREAWARLATTQGPARPVDPRELGDLRTALNMARDMETRMEIAAGWMPDMIRRSGMGVALLPRQKMEIASAVRRACA